MSDGAALLLDAKNEYLSQLNEVVGPYMLSVLDGMYAASKSVVAFQRKLREIPVWNANVIQSHVSAVESKAPWLGDLIAASFVAVVRVLSSIKLRSDKPKIRLKLPTTEAFFHKALTKLAKKMYESPELMAPRTWSARCDTVRVCIEKTIRDMLPVRELLQAYIGDSVDEEHMTMSPTPGEDSESSDSEPEQEAEIDEIFEQTKPAVTTTLEETKTVSLPAAPMPYCTEGATAGAQPHLAGAQPVNLAGTQPVSPVGTQPVSPAGSHPASPAGTQPASPVGPRPLFSDGEDDDEWRRMTR